MDDKDTSSLSLLSSSLSLFSLSPSLLSLLPSLTTTITLLSLPPPAPANKKRKLNKGVSNDYVSSNDDYPHLSRALGKEDSFKLADPTIQKIMQALLAELIGLLSKDYELILIDSADNSVSYVCPKYFQRSILPEHKRMAQRCHQNCQIKTWRPLQICLPHCQPPHPLLWRLCPCRMQDPKISCLQADECNRIFSKVEHITCK
jgi:hypothetical protein